MDYLFENLEFSDYITILTYVLGFYIVIGALILRILDKQKILFLRNDRNLLIVFCVFIIFLAGTRGIKIGTDTWNYYHYYFLRGIHINNLFDFFKYFQTDFIFEVIMFLTFPFKNFTVFLITVSAIMNLTIFKFVRKFTDYGHYGSSLILFLLIASSFSFTSHQFNTIRNGIATPFVLFAIYYFSIDQFKKGLFYFVVAYFCHRTALLPFLCVILIIASYKLHYKYFLMAYVLAIGLASTGFGFDKLAFLAEIGNDDFQKLSFSGETKYRTGFRLDFVLYNSLFLFLFLKFSSLKNNTDLFLIKYYILASIVFFFNFNIPFSDRIGVYSWIVIPLLLFNTINLSFPKKKLYVLSLVTLFYFAINYIILPLLTSSAQNSLEHY